MREWPVSEVVSLTVRLYVAPEVANSSKGEPLSTRYGIQSNVALAITLKLSSCS